MASSVRFSLIHRHVGREYLLSFIVAFFFFFFIFFINQILLIAQRILLKQVNLMAVLQLVILSIPQFLLYTFPFSCLTASSMVIGDLAGSNEILAIRSSGISLKHVFLPIVVISILFSLVTFWVADQAIPWSTKMYKELYSGLMRELPTIELQPYGTNTLSDTVLVNREVEGSTVRNIVLFDTSKVRQGKILTAPRAEISLYDLQSFIYRLNLTDPLILTSESNGDWALSKAESARFYLNFSNQISSLATALPSQLSIKELKQNIQTHRISYEEELSRYENRLIELAKLIEESEKGGDLQQLERLKQEQVTLKERKPIDFYYQYYRAEFHKKYALSAACFMLVFLTFSLSFFRVKHGRLIGFGLSMLAAVLYWYLLFFAQLQIFSLSISPALLIWAPNLIMFLTAVVLLIRARRI